MNVRLPSCMLFSFVVLAWSAAARADGSIGQASGVPMTVKMGSFILGDDVAGSAYGAASKVAAGLEYRLHGLSHGSRARASMYFDYAYGSGPGGNLAMYSTGVAERLSLGRPTPGGAFWYMGVGVGANLNVFSSSIRPTTTSQAAFAQKFLVGLQRGDGLFYEAYFRAAPQNAGIITSGVGLSFGYNL